MDDLISREWMMNELQKDIDWAKGNGERGLLGGFRIANRRVKCAPAAQITGDTSDGYHTFNELYHHRAVLFSVIIKAFPYKTWKAKKHHDGSMYDGMFIVGIETPDGQVTYHYDIEPYWNMFNCPEVKFAPEWDGHTAAQAIERLGKLKPVVHGRRERMDEYCNHSKTFRCSACKSEIEYSHFTRFCEYNYCPHCGAEMDLEEKDDLN